MQKDQAPSSHQALNMPHAAIYVRLSQEERTGTEDTASKLQERINACLSLAHRYNLTVDPDDIYVEVMSGSKLSNRPQCRALLSKCESRYYTHIVTAAIDRLTRGDKRDEQTIEDALLAGEITVVTESQVIEFNEDYDEKHALPFEVLAAAARQYRRAVIKKSKTAYTQRVRDGKYGIGTAPWGYKWISPATGRKTAAGWYEIDGELRLTQPPPEGHTEESYLALARRQGQPGGALLEGVECVGGAYYWLGVVLSLIPTLSSIQIARYLREQNAPLPQYPRNQDREAWICDSVLHIARNPFHAGYPSQRRTTNRAGVQKWLPEERWVYADNEQPYPHHISIEQYRANRDAITARGKNGNAPKTHKPYLLAGILFCTKNRQMSGGETTYQCRCAKIDNYTHPGSGANRPKYDAIAKEVVRGVLTALPASVSPVASNPPPTSTQPRILPQKRRELADLQKSREVMVRYGGEEAYKKAEKALLEEIATQEALERESRETLTAQEHHNNLRTLTLIREIPFDALWQEMSDYEQQQLARAVIKRFTVIASTQHQMRRDLQIEVQPYIEPYYPSRTITVKKAANRTLP